MSPGLLFYAIAALASWYWCAGMLFAFVQGLFPRIAATGRRQDLGFAILFGAISAVMWPIGLPAAWCITGFAEFGIWKAKERK